MLPEIAKIEINDDTTESDVKAASYDSFEWDFDAGDFKLTDGSVQTVSGTEYIEIWCKKALLSVYGSLIYTNYGSNHYSVIGKVLDKDYMKEELKRLIKEALMRNTDIEDVYDFNFEVDGSLVSITAKILSIYGEVTVSVG